MNVASLELCKELYELSEWEGVKRHYTTEKTDENNKTTIGVNDKGFALYDLGFMIRKLPGTILKHAVVDDKDFYFAEYLIGNNPNFTHGTGGDTPEDCLAMLAIELFKQGVLEKES